MSSLKLVTTLRNMSFRCPPELLLRQAIRFVFTAVKATIFVFRKLISPNLNSKWSRTYSEALLNCVVEFLLQYRNNHKQTWVAVRITGGLNEIYMHFKPFGEEGNKKKRKQKKKKKQKRKTNG